MGRLVALRGVLLGAVVAGAAFLLVLQSVIEDRPDPSGPSVGESDALRLPRLVLSAAKGMVLPDGAVSEFAVEQDDAQENTSLRPPLADESHWEVDLSQQGRVLEEFGLDSNASFETVRELEELLGQRCPPRRHCSVKFGRDVLFLRGGEWKTAQFHPFDCWMYHFDGNEAWTETDLHLTRVIFVSGERDMFWRKVAVSHPLFQFMEFNFPKEMEDMIRFEAEVLNLLGHTDDSELLERLLVVVDWSAGARMAKQAAGGLVRRLRRINLTNVAARFEIMVPALSFPFGSEGEIEKIVEWNERLAEAFSFKSRRYGAIMRRPSLGKPPPKRPLVGRLSSEDAVSKASPTAFLVHVTANPNTVVYANTFTLSPEMIFGGWIPNVPTTITLFLFCQEEAVKANCLRVANKLIDFGFLDLAFITDEPSEDLQNALRRLPGGGSLVGLDMFAASIGVPSDASAKERFSLLVDFARDMVLNEAFRRELVGLAQDSERHPCVSELEQEDRCTSCIMTPARIPGERMSFPVVTKYLPGRSVPTILELTKGQKIWEGSWTEFLKQNKDSSVKVRRDYASVRTRQFEQQKLENYLVNVGVLVQDPKTKTLREKEETRRENAADGNSSLPLYAGNNKLDKQAMRRFNFKYPKWIRDSSFERPALWMGPRGSFSSLHMDHDNRGNLAYQVLGIKEWHLFSPDSKPYMYSSNSRKGTVFWSRIVDPRSFKGEKATRFPLFKEGLCKSMLVEVREGEALFNPNLWWHAVYNVKASLMLNFWIQNEKKLAKVLPPQTQPQQQQQKKNMRSGRGKL